MKNNLTQKEKCSREMEFCDLDVNVDRGSNKIKDGRV